MAAGSPPLAVIGGSPATVFDGLAECYEDHFKVPHRRVYDDLAWERVSRLLPGGGLVIDAGCGIGRWARRFVGLGHRVIGIEASPRMAAASRQLARDLGGDSFVVIESDMSEASPEVGRGADLVAAMGSLQYVADPAAVLGRFASWLRPGGTVALLVDSRVALALELIAAGKADEAVERLATGRGVWSPSEVPGATTEFWLFTRSSLEEMVIAAGFERVRACGLAVSVVATGRCAFSAAFAQDPGAVMSLNRRLADDPLLADVGKQLLVTAHRPAP